MTCGYASGPCGPVVIPEVHTSAAPLHQLAFTGVSLWPFIVVAAVLLFVGLALASLRMSSRSR